MLEVAPVDMAVIACLAPPETLDAFPEPEGVRSCRISRGELHLVGPGTRRGAVLEAARDHLAGADPDGLAVDVGDGWSGWSVRGEAADEILARLSVLAIPAERPAFLQGAVAQVPAKVLLEEGGMLVLVPSPVGHHLRDRILRAGGDLGVELADAPSAPVGSLRSAEPPVGVPAGGDPGDGKVDEGGRG